MNRKATLTNKATGFKSESDRLSAIEPNKPARPAESETIFSESDAPSDNEPDKSVAVKLETLSAELETLSESEEVPIGKPDLLPFSESEKCAGSKRSKTSSTPPGRSAAFIFNKISRNGR